MSETFQIDTTARSISSAPARHATVSVGVGTVYYGKERTVSSSSKDGTLTAGQSETFTDGPRWLVSNSTGARVFVSYSPEYTTDMATQAELDAAETAGATKAELTAKFEGNTLKEASLPPSVALGSISAPAYEFVELYIGAIQQSNGQGAAEKAATTPPAGMAYMWKPSHEEKPGVFTTAEWIPLKDPVGEGAGSSLEAADDGSAWPNFAIQRANLTLRPMYYVTHAKGGSAMVAASDLGNGNWDVTGTLVEETIERVEAAIKQLLSERKIPILRGIFICQGERDALAKEEGKEVTQAKYRAAMETALSRLRAVFGLTLPAYIFRLGRKKTEDTAAFQEIRAAQEEVAAADRYTHIVFTGAVNFPEEGKMNSEPSKELVHYSLEGYEDMGETGAGAILAIEQPLTFSLIDTFTGKAGIKLTEHRGERGARWTRNTAFAEGVAILANTRGETRMEVEEKPTVYYASSDCGTAYRQWCAIRYRKKSTPAWVAPCIRMETGANTMYQAQLNLSNGVLKLKRFVAGVEATLAEKTLSENPAEGFIYLEAEDDVLRVYWAPVGGGIFTIPSLVIPDTVDSKVAEVTGKKKGFYLLGKAGAEVGARVKWISGGEGNSPALNPAVATTPAAPVAVAA